MALLGLLACVWVLLLGIFVYRAPLIDAPDTLNAPFLLSPTLGGVNWPLFVWSVGIVLFMPLVAIAPMRTSFRDRPSEALRSFGRLCLAAGVLGAILIVVRGLNWIAASGGNADPHALQLVVGRMLVPALLGLLVMIGTHCLPARSLPVPLSAATTH